MPHQKYLSDHHYIVTSGTGHLDMDAFACCLGMVDYLTKIGVSSEFVSSAPLNASVPLPYRQNYPSKPEILSINDSQRYILCDISEPEFFDPNVRFDSIFEIIDHHFGFESYWNNQEVHSTIRPVAACASLIVEKFSKVSLFPESGIAHLLKMAIISNSLNFSLRLSGSTDQDAFNYLGKNSDGISQDELAKMYFISCQDEFYKNPIENLSLDSKICHLSDQRVQFYQSECWEIHNRDFQNFFDQLQKKGSLDLATVLNVVSVKDKCSYFYADNLDFIEYLSSMYSVSRLSRQCIQTEVPMLRKEIIRDFSKYHAI